METGGTKKKPGPAAQGMERTSLLLPGELLRWAKAEPEGLSGLVRELLRGEKAEREDQQASGISASDLKTANPLRLEVIGVDAELGRVTLDTKCDNAKGDHIFMVIACDRDRMPAIGDYVSIYERFERRTTTPEQIEKQLADAAWIAERFKEVTR